MVAKVIALNTSDHERIQVPLAPVPSKNIPASSAGDGVDKPPTPTQQPVEEEGSARADLSDANCGQLDLDQKAELMVLFDQCNRTGVFAIDPKEVPAAK